MFLFCLLAYLSVCGGKGCLWSFALRKLCRGKTQYLDALFYKQKVDRSETRKKKFSYSFFFFFTFTVFFPMNVQSDCQKKCSPPFPPPPPLFPLCYGPFHRPRWEVLPRETWLTFLWGKPAAMVRPPALINPQDRQALNFVQDNHVTGTLAGLSYS